MKMHNLIAVFARINPPTRLLSPRCQQCLIKIKKARSFSSNVKEWSFTDLKLYGRVVVRSCSAKPLAFNLTHLNPHDFPSQDQAIVKLISSSDADLSDILNCSLENDHIKISDGNVDILDRNETSDLECNIQVPLKYDCDVKLEGQNSISLSNFENQDIDVQVQHGHCYLKNIKTGNAQIRSESGAIVSESLLQGNTFITSEGGNISLHKPVCQTLTLQTNEGDIHVQNLYADKSSIKTSNGDVHIGSCHRNVQVDIGYQGNFKADSVDGQLKVDIKSGNADVLVSQHEWVSISTGNGDVTVRLSEELPSTLEARGESVTMDQSLSLEVNEDRTSDDKLHTIKGTLVGDATSRRLSEIGHIRLEAPRGHVNVKCQDWLSSLNLRKLKPE